MQARTDSLEAQLQSITEARIARKGRPYRNVASRTDHTQADPRVWPVDGAFVAPYKLPPSREALEAEAKERATKAAARRVRQATDRADKAKAKAAAARAELNALLEGRKKAESEFGLEAVARAVQNARAACRPLDEAAADALMEAAEARKVAAAVSEGDLGEYAAPPDAAPPPPDAECTPPMSM